MKINIIGLFPPPLGGISSHILRLAQNLINKGYDVSVFDDRCYPFNSFKAKIIELTKNKHFRIKNIGCDSKQPFGTDLRIYKGFGKLYSYFLFKRIEVKEIIHYHHIEFELYGALLMTLHIFRKRLNIIVTLHSLRDSSEKLSSFKKLYLMLYKYFSSHIIVVNNEIKEKLIRYGIKEEKISIIPAFLPPIKKEEDFNLIPNKIWDFMENHSPIITANASRIIFHEGFDLYGLDMCVELCARLKEDFQRIGFVFCLPGVSEDNEYIIKTRAQIEELNLSGNFMLITETYQFYPLLQKSNLFVRPTNSDGDAISIREALYFGVPVAASDIVPRPKGTTIFRNRDSADFYKQVLPLLFKNEEYADMLKNINLKEDLDPILKLYNDA